MPTQYPDHVDRDCSAWPRGCRRAERLGPIPGEHQDRVKTVNACGHLAVGNLQPPPVKRGAPLPTRRQRQRA